MFIIYLVIIMGILLSQCRFANLPCYHFLVQQKIVFGEERIKGIKRSGQDEAIENCTIKDNPMEEQSVYYP